MRIHFLAGVSITSVFTSALNPYFVNVADCHPLFFESGTCSSRVSGVSEKLLDFIKFSEKDGYIKTLVRPEQPWKVPGKKVSPPIEVTLLGIVILVRLVQL